MNDNCGRERKTIADKYEYVKHEKLYKKFEKNFGKVTKGYVSPFVNCYTGFSVAWFHNG